jgi:hypothetical protein
VRLHALVGCGALLRPLLPPPGALAELIGGAALRAPEVSWLSRDADLVGHDFLIEPISDRRLDVFAAALSDNFGARFEPLVLLPDALGNPDEPATVAAAVKALGGLWHRLPAALTLHALALPPSVDGGDGWIAEAGLDVAAARARLEALRATLTPGTEGVEATGALTTAVLAPAPDGPARKVFDMLLRNALAHALAARAAAPLADAGLEPRHIARAAARRLGVWAENGLVPRLPLDAARLDRMTSRLIEVLIAAGGRHG